MIKCSELRICILTKFGTTTLIGITLLSSACQTSNLTLNRTSPAELLVAPLRQTVQPVPVGGMVEVDENDTLFDLATRYNVTPQSIIETNDLSPPYVLRRGTVLKIIPQRTHVVHHGDSVYVISQRYAVSQYQLAQLNGLSPPFELEVGQGFSYRIHWIFLYLIAASLMASAARILRSLQLCLKKTSTPTSLNGLLRLSLVLIPGLHGQWKGKLLLNLAPHSVGFTMMASISQRNRGCGWSSRERACCFCRSEYQKLWPTCLIKHDGGITTAYAHLGDIAVKEGDIVTLGQAIGSIGKSGRVETPQLLLKFENYVNPLIPEALFLSYIIFWVVEGLSLIAQSQLNRYLIIL